jgi:hypothetical protein
MVWELMFIPLEIPVIFGGNHLLQKKGRGRPLFSHGVIQIALTRQGSIHLLSMMLNPSD